MEFSNQKRSKKIKQTFNLIGILIVVVGLGFLWLKMDTAVLITAGVFAIYVGISQFANLCYISFSTNNNKVLIRYYPIISLMKKEFDSIEFPHQSLLNFRIEKSMGFSDLDIAIRAKRGIAEYPTISLSALTKEEIEQIRKALIEIVIANSKN